MKTNISKKELFNMLSELLEQVQEVGAAVGSPELNYMTDEFCDQYAEFETLLETLIDNSKLLQPKKDTSKASDLTDFNKTIEPFYISEHDDGWYALLTDDDSVNSGFDWDILMQNFIAEYMPKASSLLKYDSEAGMFCMFCRKLPKLKKIAIDFKRICDKG